MTEYCLVPYTAALPDGFEKSATGCLLAKGHKGPPPRRPPPALGAAGMTAHCRAPTPSKLPPNMSPGSYPVCYLDAGHDGPHRDIVHVKESAFVAWNDGDDAAKACPPGVVLA
jgi:hypothetical protein